jgi:hypothetical protein
MEYYSWLNLKKVKSEYILLFYVAYQVLTFGLIFFQGLILLVPFSVNSFFFNLVVVAY